MKGHTNFAIVISAMAIFLAGCERQPAMEEKKAEPRAVVTINQDSETTKVAGGVDCIDGRKVTVEVEITGNFGALSDSVAGEARCDQDLRASAIATAQPPIGFDANQATGVQTQGAAICNAGIATIPNPPQQPVWEVVCRFY